MVSHTEGDYYGDSDLENLEDEDTEEGKGPDESKSECSSVVSCLWYYCIAMQTPLV